jgi:hypothetical protein
MVAALTIGKNPEIFGGNRPDFMRVVARRLMG